MDENTTKLVELIDEFIDGRERTVAFANRIEGFILQNCLAEPVHDALLEDLVGSLALYSPPKAEPHLLGEAELVQELRHAREQLLARR